MRTNMFCVAKSSKPALLGTCSRRVGIRNSVYIRLDNVYTLLFVSRNDASMSLRGNVMILAPHSGPPVNFGSMQEPCSVYLVATHIESSSQQIFAARFIVIILGGMHTTMIVVAKSSKLVQFKGWTRTVSLVILY